MNNHPDEFAVYREYAGSTQHVDYTNPDYYAQGLSEGAERAHVAPAPDPYTAPRASYPDYTYANDAPPMESYASGQVQEYYVPQGEGYAGDGAAEAQGEKGKLRETRKGIAGLGGIGAAIIAWIVKLKSLAFLLKFGVAGFSALLSIFVYSFRYGWVFAIGIVALLFIHEMGHAVVIKLKGIPVGGMIFIPMLGAVVTMKNMPDNARDEAEIGIAGPIAGTIASFVCLFIAQMHPGEPGIWAPLAYFGFFINLFNLIPIVPFDGGRVLAAIDRRVWIVGFLALLAFQIWSWINGNFSWWLLIFVLLAGTQLWSRGLSPTPSEKSSYYAVPVGTRIMLTLLYFGLATVLFLGMNMAHTLMPFIR